MPGEAQFRYAWFPVIKRKPPGRKAGRLAGFASRSLEHAPARLRRCHVAVSISTHGEKPVSTHAEKPVASCPRPRGGTNVAPAVQELPRVGRLGRARRIPADVLVEGERIRAVATQRGQLESAGAETIEANGMTLMPGLVEGHAHITFINARASPPISATRRRRNTR